jgi:DNA-binding beta-propeller fold protein YncE
VAVNPVTNKTYVANYSGKTVTVIDGATFSTQTVPAGNGPAAITVNSVTNKIYAVNYCGNDPNCLSAGTLTAIDGVTLSTQTVTVGFYPDAVAVNPVTNKIYVANGCRDSSCTSGTVTVIDGATLSTQTVNNVVLGATDAAVDSVTNKIYVTAFFGNSLAVIDGSTLSTQILSNVGVETAGLAVNPETNKIYVANHCGTDPNCKSNGTVTVIDGATLSTQSVPVAFFPNQVAVNPVTNQIYVTNQCGTDPNCKSSGTVTVIDGATLTTQSVSAEYHPYSVAVDSVTNKIYVANRCGNDPTCNSPGTVAVIDGATLSTTPLTVGAVPWAVTINSVTNRIYVANYSDMTASVIAGPNANALQFVPVSPCRVVDTRGANGEFGGPPLQAQQTRSFPIPSNQNCDIPSSAAAYSLNVTVVPHGPLGYLTVWPTGEDQPVVSTLNSVDGRVKANAAIVPAGYQGAVSFFVTNTTDLILDIDGYFAPANQSTLAFYPLTPCRLADTRGPHGPLGGPYLMGGVNRDFPLLDATSCFPKGVTPTAYSLNFTAVPHGSLGYLTVCPTPSDPSQNCPLVSTLNSYGGQVVANAAIVPAGVNGEIRTFPFNDTDLIIDINGYFGAPGQNGLSLYPVAPCRVLDTRPPSGGGPFQFELEPPVDVLGSVCAPPSQSQAYVFNATVVPQGPLGYLTLWPDGGNQPLVSTLNAYDGVISSNMAIVPAGKTNGKVDAYAAPVYPKDPTDLTNLILDISSYFAP